MKSVLLRDNDKAPESEGRNRTTRSSTHDRHSSDARIAGRARCSLFFPSANLKISNRNSCCCIPRSEASAVRSACREIRMCSAYCHHDSVSLLSRGSNSRPCLGDSHRIAESCVPALDQSDTASFVLSGHIEITYWVASLLRSRSCNARMRIRCAA